MDSRCQRINPNLVSFIRDLTGATTVEVQECISEVTSNKVFYKNLEKNRNNLTRRFSSYGWGVDSTLGTILYTVCRKMLPDTIVETGVASGVSSSYILFALNENSHGKLYSIDLPSGRNEQSGWLIPDYLKPRWELIQGRSSEKLLPLLERLKTIDIFLHDSEHSYRNMLWEFQTAWGRLRTGGILLSHNINWSDAFADFTKVSKVKPIIFGDTGGIVKI